MKKYLSCLAPLFVGLGLGVALAVTEPNPAAEGVGVVEREVLADVWLLFGIVASLILFATLAVNDLFVWWDQRTARSVLRRLDAERSRPTERAPRNEAERGRQSS